MNTYSATSEKNLKECHDDLQRLFRAVLPHWDHSIVDGARSLIEQQKNVAKGVSKTMDSKHLPQADGTSHAVDATPFPAPDWNVIERALSALRGSPGHPGIDPTMQLVRFYAFNGFVAGMAAAMGIPIRQGDDWNGDRQFGDHSFIDLPHTELRI